MKMSYKRYLELRLESVELGLQEYIIQHRIHKALYEQKKEIMENEIDSLKRILEENKDE